MRCEADEKCKKASLWRPDVGKWLCADHYAEAIARLRPSRYVRCRPLPTGCFDLVPSSKNRDST